MPIHLLHAYGWTEDGQTNIEVKIEDDTVWLTQQQLTKLYQCSKSNISEYIKHIFEEGELVKDSVVRKFRTTADEGKNIMLLITIWIWLSFLYTVLNQWLQQDSGSGSILLSQRTKKHSECKMKWCIRKWNRKKYR